MSHYPFPLSIDFINQCGIETSATGGAMSDRLGLIYSVGGSDDRKEHGTTSTQIHILTKTFLKYDNPSGHVRLVGLIFGRPYLPLVQKEIIPNLSYWNQRSGSHSDFFCIGFSDKSDEFHEE